MTVKFITGRVVQTGESLSHSPFTCDLFLFCVIAQLSSASDYLSNKVSIMDYNHLFKCKFKARDGFRKIFLPRYLKTASKSLVIVHNSDSG